MCYSESELLWSVEREHLSGRALRASLYHHITYENLSSADKYLLILLLSNNQHIADLCLVPY